MLCASRTNHEVLLHDLVENGTPETPWVGDWFSSPKKMLKEKHNPFINLPYLVDKAKDKEVVICQSNAIMSYLGRELNMLGDNAVEAVKCEELLCEIYDLRNEMVAFSYKMEATPENAKKVLAKSMGHFGKFEQHFEQKSGKECFLVGDKMSAPDFHLFEMLDQYEGLCKLFSLGELYADLPHLKAFKTGFENLSENKFYLESTFHKELPFNNCVAGFASQVGVAPFERGGSAPWRAKGKVSLKAP